MPWSLDMVTPLRAETFYRATIMLSQTLGAALAGFLADTGGLRCSGGALLFWAAFILTRPLGAT